MLPPRGQGVTLGPSPHSSYPVVVTQAHPPRDRHRFPIPGKAGHCPQLPLVEAHAAMRPGPRDNTFPEPGGGRPPHGHHGCTRPAHGGGRPGVCSKGAARGQPEGRKMRSEATKQFIPVLCCPKGQRAGQPGALCSHPRHRLGLGKGAATHPRVVTWNWTGTRAADVLAPGRQRG